MPGPDPYATATDLAARWRALDTVEATRADVLLGDASYWVRQWFPAETARIDAGDTDATGAKILVCAMVKRALIALDDDGTSSETATEAYGPFSRTQSRAFSNPQGNLYITDAECKMLQGRDSGAVSMTMRGLGGL